MISQELAEQFRKEIILKKKLSALQAEIKDSKQKITEHMRIKELKYLVDHGIKITYTPPRDYKALYDSKMAFKYLEKHRPDLVETRNGYERLSVSLEKI